MMLASHSLLLQYRKKEIEEWISVPFVDKIVIGSGDKADLRLEDGDISTVHFEIRENPTGIYLKDIDPERGVTILDEMVLDADVPNLLTLGQQFTAGDYVFQLIPDLAQNGVIFSETKGGEAGEIKKQLQTAAGTVGKKRLLVILAAIILISITGALLIYFLFLRPAQIPSVPLPSEVAVGTESVSTAEGGFEPTPTFGVDQTAVVETLDQLIQAPGEGQINVESLDLGGNGLSLSQLSQLVLNPDEALTMAVDLYGENVAYAYVYTGILVEGKVLTTVMEFIQAEDSQMVDGVLAPDWGDNPSIPLNFDWKPFVYQITDGKETIVALLMPERYSTDPADIVYHVDGIYQPKGGDLRYDAYMRFDSDGNMLDVLTFGLLGSDRGTPYKVQPQIGDTFVVYDQEFLVNPESEQEMPITIPNSVLSPALQTLLFNSMKDEIGYAFGLGEFILHEGEKLTFGEKGITWSKNPNFDGDYVAGFAIQDLDSNFYVGYIPVIAEIP